MLSEIQFEIAIHTYIGRFVGLFRRHVRKIQKKISLQSKYLYINTMATGIAQKSYKALFPLWSLKKKRYVEINKLKIT